MYTTRTSMLIQFVSTHHRRENRIHRHAKRLITYHDAHVPTTECVVLHLHPGAFEQAPASLTDSNINAQQNILLLHFVLVMRSVFCFLFAVLACRHNKNFLLPLLCGHCKK